MAKLIGSQLSLIAESDFEYRPVGDWDYDELGTENLLVPNSTKQKLGTENLLFPNFPTSELGTENLLVPNSTKQKLGTENLLVPNFPTSESSPSKWTPPDYTDWKPPIGGLELKWVKDHKYWYWRYYDIDGKKASKYLHKDYDKAVRKAIKIGVPTDAKLPKPTHSKACPQTQHPTAENLIDIAQTAHPASRAA
jgi:hypothetical protein